jgi:hypothetical protein
MQVYLLQAIATMLSVRLLSQSTMGEKATSVALLLLLCIGFPFFSITFLYRKREHLEDPDF